MCVASGVLIDNNFKVGQQDWLKLWRNDAVGFGFVFAIWETFC